jgi:trehalose-phosphatase
MKDLLTCWPRVEKTIEGKCVMLFLDYDGTLAPIADAPEKALLPAATKGLLRRLSKKKGFKVAIISGRSLRDIKSIVGLRGIVYAGNHGLQLEGPKIRYRSFIPGKYLKVIAEIKKQLQWKIGHVKGAFIEDKGHSLALHFRLASKSGRDVAKTLFHEAVAAYMVKEIVKVKSGKMVLEVLPPLAWDKGKIALWLLARQRFSTRRGGIVPIYVGDDNTDEDAFRALKGGGLTVHVGKGKKSSARYSLRDTNETADFLRLLLQLKGATP